MKESRYFTAFFLMVMTIVLSGSVSAEAKVKNISIKTKYMSVSSVKLSWNKMNKVNKIKIFRAAVKPVPSIFTEQLTVNKEGKETTICIEGRHDVCLCPRIVPVIEAMTAVTLADMILRNRSSRI